MSTSVTTKDVRELITIVENSEDSFDPFMLRHHVFTKEQEKRWMSMVIVTFIEFCKEEMPSTDFFLMRRRVRSVYGKSGSV